MRSIRHIIDRSNVQIFVAVLVLLSAATVPIGVVTAAEGGELTIDVVHENGDQANEVNALIIYQDGKHYNTIENYPSVNLEHTFSNLPTGHDYTVNAYIHDQTAGSVDSVTISEDKSWTPWDESSKSKILPVANPIELSPTVYYSDGSTPLEDAHVQVKSHENDPNGAGKVVWRSGTVASDGSVDPSPLYLFPTDGDDPGKYFVEVTHNGNTVANQTFDDLDSDSSPSIVTNANVPSFDVDTSSTSGGSVDGGLSGDVERGTTVTLTADADNDYKFDHWSGDVPAGLEYDSTLSMTIDSDTSVRAHFDQMQGVMTVDVHHANGDQATEVNKLVVWQDSVGADDFLRFPGGRGHPSYGGPQLVKLPRGIALSGGHEYNVNAYINDQFAGTTGWVPIQDSDVSKTINVDDSVWIRPKVTYSDGLTPLPNATVSIDSHEGVEWRSGTTQSDGITAPEKLWLHPTDEGYYDVTVTYDGQQVASKRIKSLDSSHGISLTTTVKGEVAGSISGYKSPDTSTDYELGRWYDVTIGVRNNGPTEQSFTVRAKTPTGTETKSDRKSLTLKAGENDPVNFKQRWYGTHTQTRSFSHDLMADTDDDGTKEKLDSASISLGEPANGELHLEPNTGDEGSALIDVTVTNSETGEIEVQRSIRTDGTDVSAKVFPVPAGQYDITVDSEGYRSKTVTASIEADTTRLIEPLLTPTGVNAKIDDDVAVESSTYETGDSVNATVDVINTGEKRWEFFVGYSVRHNESGETYDNTGQTGTFVSLKPGERKTVTLEWLVDNGAKGGEYDVLTAVWFGYPEDGANQIQSSGWTNGAFEVSGVQTTTIEYQDTQYTIEHRQSGAIAVYGPSGQLVDAETAKSVLEYKTFMEYSVDNATGGWWEVTNQGESLETFYWSAHLNQGAITALKGYVKAHFGSYKDSMGEFVEMSAQSTRLMNEQLSGSSYEFLEEYSIKTKQAYGMYDGTKAGIERLQKASELVSTAYGIKKRSDDVDTMTDAVRRTSDTSDATDTLQGIAIEAGMAPLNDVSAGLKTTEKQSLLASQWGKTSKPVLQMLENLEQRRNAGTITTEEMRLYYYLQTRFYSSQTQMWRHMAALQKSGEQSSTSFDLISSIHSNSPEQFKQNSDGTLTLVELKTNAMGRFLSQSEILINRSVNVKNDPVKTQLDTPEPLLVEPTSWTAPGDTATIRISSRNEPVINAVVTVGDKIVETDKNGEATVTFYEPGTYEVTVSKKGFTTTSSALIVREPAVATQGFLPVSFGTLSGEAPVTESTKMNNSGDVAIEVKNVLTDHDALSASILKGHAEPGETISISVTADPSVLSNKSFYGYVIVEWPSTEDTTRIPVNGTAIDVGTESPKAVIDAAQTSLGVEEQTTLEAGASTDPDGDVQLYEWDFDGDGQTDTTGETATHAFETAADYNVSLTVTDDDGKTDTDTATITVTPDTGSASFGVSITETNSPVEAGSQLEIDANVTNTGSASGTETIELLDTAGNVVNTQDVALDSGNHQSLTLTWQTDNSDAGSGDITVRSDENSATSPVTVEGSSQCTNTAEFGFFDDTGNLVADRVINYEVTTPTGQTLVESDTANGEAIATQTWTEGAEYTVSANASGYQHQSTTFVGCGPAQVSVTLPRTGPGTISGVVTDTGGDPVANAEITLLQDGTTVVNTTTMNGEYVADISPGTYTVRGSKSGYQSGQASVTIQSDETATANIVLKEEDSSAYVYHVPHVLNEQQLSDAWSTKLSVRATNVSADIEIDTDGDGANEKTTTLAPGEGMSASTPSVGAVVTSTAPVEVSYRYKSVDFGAYEDGQYKYGIPESSLLGTEYYVPMAAEKLTVTATDTTEVRVDTDGDGQTDQSISVGAGETQSFSNIEAGAHVVADADVHAVVSNARWSNMDDTYAASLLPVSQAQTAYTLPAHGDYNLQNPTDKTRVALVGTQDSTSVTVGGQQLTLSTGEVATVQTNGKTTVSADAPVVALYAVDFSAEDWWGSEVREYIGVTTPVDDVKIRAGEWSGKHFDGGLQMWSPYATLSTESPDDGGTYSAQNALAIDEPSGVGYVIENDDIVAFDMSTREQLHSFPGPDGTDKGLAYGAGSLWYADAAPDAYDGQILELNPKTGEVRSEINTGYDPYGLAFGDGSLWAGEVTGIPNNVYEFSPDGQQIGSFDISGPAGSNGPNGLAYYNGLVWVGTHGTLVALDTNGNVKQRIDDAEMSYSGLAGTENALYGPEANGNLTVILGDDDESSGDVDFGIELQQQATVEQGGAVSITAYAANNAGTAVTDATLELLVDNDHDEEFEQSDIVATQDVAFDASEYRTINLSYPNVQLATGEYQYQARITAQGDTITSYTNGTLTVGDDESGTTNQTTINTSASSITPRSVTTGETQEYTIFAQIKNMSADATGEVDFRLPEFTLSSNEDDITIDYTSDNISDGTLTVSKTVTATAPEKSGAYVVELTDVRTETGTDVVEYLIEDANVAFDDVAVKKGRTRTALTLLANQTSIDAGQPVEFALTADGETVDGTVSLAGTEKQTTNGTVVFEVETVGQLLVTATKQPNDTTTFEQAATTVKSQSPSLSVEQDEVSFGAVRLSEKPTSEIVVKNNGSIPVDLASAEIRGPDADAFALDTERVPAEIQANGSRTLNVTFQPLDRSQADARLELDSSVPGQSPSVVNLSGTGTAPRINVTSQLPAQLIALQENSDDVSVEIANDGDAELKASLSIEDDAFDVSQSDITISDGKTETVNVTFEPSSRDTGTIFTTLRITPNSEEVSARTVPIVGTVERKEISLVPSSINFGETIVGETETAAATVVNTGMTDVDLTVSVSSERHDGEFALRDGSGDITLAPGAAQRLPLKATLDQTGTVNGTLSVSSGSGPNETTHLTAAGAAPNLTVTSADPVTLTDTPTGSTTTKQIDIRNDGNATLRVGLDEAFNDSESDAGFGIVGASNMLRIPAGDTRSVPVGFTPPRTGKATATLSLTTNDYVATTQQENVTISARGIETDLSVSDSTLAFGKLGVGGTSDAQTLTVTNDGNSTLDLTQETTGADGFSAGSFPGSLDPDGSATIDVTFTPTTNGSRTGKLTISASAGDQLTSVSATLAGTGRLPDLRIGQKQLRTGYADVSGGETTTGSLTITNAGPAETELTITDLTVANAAQFSVATETPVTVAGGTTESVDVQFEPDESGEQQTDLDITVEGPERTLTRTVPVTGIGSGPEPIVTPEQLSLGSVAVNETAGQTVTVSNTGGASFIITNVTTNSNGVRAERLGLAEIVPGGESTIAIGATPSTNGPIDANVTVETIGADDLLIDVTGTAVAPETNLSTDSIAFGETSLGSASQQSITIENTGEAPLEMANPTISGANPDAFRVLGGDRKLRIEAGASKTVTVGFAPRKSNTDDTRTANATLTIEPRNEPGVGQQTIDLGGTGVDANATLNASAVSFGDVPQGGTETRSLKLTNDGSAPLDVLGVSVLGADSEAYNVSGLGTPTLAEGENVTFQVNVTATSRGSLTSQLEIATSESPVTSSLGATGVAPEIDIGQRTVSADAFGTTRLGSTATTALPVNNTGNAPLDLTKVTIEGADAEAFDIVEQPDNGTIGPKSTGRLVVEFAPGEVANAVTRAQNTPLSATADLVVNSTDSDEQSQTVSLSGEGVTPAFESTQRTLRFGTTPIGETSSRQVTVRNDLTATAAINVTGVSLGGVDSDEYSATLQGQNTPTTLTPGDSATINVSLTPTSFDQKYATLSVETNGTRHPVRKIGLSNTETVYRVVYGSVHVTYINPAKGEQPTVNVNEGLQAGNASLRTVTGAANTTTDYSLNFSTKATPYAEGPALNNETYEPIQYVSATTDAKNFKNATFTVTVSKAALANTGTSPENVTIFHERGNGYEALETELLYETRLGYVYETTTPSFSVFAIGVQSIDATSDNSDDSSSENVNDNSDDTDSTHEDTDDSIDAIDSGGPSNSEETDSSITTTQQPPTKTEPTTTKTEQTSTLTEQTPTTTEPTPTTTEQTSTPTEQTPTVTEQAPTTSPKTTSGSVPGFGVIVTLGALVLAIGILAHRRRFT